MVRTPCSRSQPRMTRLSVQRSRLDRGLEIAERFSLEKIAIAQEPVERPQRRWRIVMVL